MGGAAVEPSEAPPGPLIYSGALARHTCGYPSGMTDIRQRSELAEVIVADHRAVDEVFSELETGAGDPQRRKELVDHVITELVRHSVAEEQYVYPVMRSVLGDEEADRELHEHAEAEQVMKKLDGMAVTDERFGPALQQLITDIRHHVSDEENDMLPRLVQGCDKSELEDLAEKFEHAKRSAPTRPHPSAPDRSPANQLLDSGAALVDRMRDALSGRNT